MHRTTTVLAGGLAGLGVGVLLLVVTHPAAAYTNDAYRQGASVGFVVRYVVLGIVAALLVRTVRAKRRTAPAAIGLVVVAALAILPPALDRDSKSERRRAAANASGDPDAKFRAGAIDGCVKSTTREVRRSHVDLDADAYCTCLVEALARGPGDDSNEIEAAARDIAGGRPSAKVRRTQRRCATRARRR